MNPDSRSLLQAKRDPLAVHLLVSVVFHVVGVSMFVCVGMITSFNSTPIIDPDQAIEVAIVSLPRSNKAVPDRAQRAPIPTAPQPSPVAKPQPPDRSLQKEPQPQTGRPDRTAEMEDLLRDLELDTTLADLEAPTGPRDRLPTSPDGLDDVPHAALGTVGAIGDPEWEAYKRLVSRTFNEHFHPLQAIVRANPGLVCYAYVSIDTNGKVLDWRITDSSGNPSFDRAAEAAVQAVPSLPLPPEQYRARTAEGFRVQFEPIL